MTAVSFRACVLVMTTVAIGAPPALTDRTIDVAGTPIKISCGGERTPGSPMVVLEAGAGNGANTWWRVHPAIAEFARVCAYDRPTLGRNSPARPPTPMPDAVVATLDGLLEGAGERGPYVLVGHSAGGMIVRLFASRFPERVKGMVLIESSHEDQVRRFEELNPAQAGSPRPPGVFEPFEPAAMSAALSAANWHASIPLLVLTRGVPMPSADQYALWLELQGELASRSPRGEHVIAKQSEHFIHIDEPQLVLDGIRRMLSQ
jgi:pimeloyl-ACP methyl ester carboxylesterase